MAWTRDETGRTLNPTRPATALLLLQRETWKETKPALNRWWIPKCDNGIGIQNQKIKLKTSSYGGWGWLDPCKEGQTKASRHVGTSMASHPHLVCCCTRAWADHHHQFVESPPVRGPSLGGGAKIQVPPKPKILKSRP